MNKHELLSALRKGLRGLPPKEIEERIIFYSEMIDDCMEEGCTEAEAVARIGDVDAIVSQIVGETPVVKSKSAGKAWSIAGLVLGAPIWLPLLISAIAVVLSLYICLWTVVIFLWATEVSLWGCALAGMVAGPGYIAGGYITTGLAMISAGLVCAGLSVFLFWGCKWATKGTACLAKPFARSVKMRILKGRSYYA